MPASRRGPLGDLRRTHGVLRRLGVVHAVIGGWAVVAWGSVRATRDLDFLVLLAGRAGRERLARVFERRGYSVDRRVGDPEDPVPELIRLVPKESDRLEIDLLPALRGFQAAALGRAVDVDMGGWRVPVVRPEDLVAMKLAAGGGVDLQDAAAILRVQGERLDRDLLVESCRRLRVLEGLARAQGS